MDADGVDANDLRRKLRSVRVVEFEDSAWRGIGTLETSVPRWHMDRTRDWAANKGETRF